MKITAIKSLCCGNGVKQRNLYANVKTPKEWGDKIYICQKCKQPAEVYFMAEIGRF